MAMAFKMGEMKNNFYEILKAVNVSERDRLNLLLGKK